MAELQQLLMIYPDKELKFDGPFGTSAASMLTLFNPTNTRICFKIKTTSPKTYQVEPRAGILDPDRSSSIFVAYHPSALESDGHKHKFLVQALSIPDGEGSLEDFWKNANPNELMETKLGSKFEMPLDDANQNDLSTTEEEQQQDGRSKDEDMTMDTMSADDNRGGDSGISIEVEKLQGENVLLKEEVDRLKRRMTACEPKEGGDLDQGICGHRSPYVMQYLAGAIFIALAGVVGMLFSKFL